MYTTIHPSTASLRSPPRMRHPMALSASYDRGGMPTHQITPPAMIAAPLRTVTPSDDSGVVLSRERTNAKRREVYVAPHRSHPTDPHTMVREADARPSPQWQQPSGASYHYQAPQQSPHVVVVSQPSPSPSNDLELQRHVLSVESKLDRLLERKEAPHAYAYSPYRNVADASRSQLYHAHAQPTMPSYGYDLTQSQRPLYPSDDSMRWTTFLPDPHAVAAALYRPIGPATMSPPRRHPVGPPPRYDAPPLPIVQVPPPPLLPAYPPARDHIEELEAYYARLALQNLLQDEELREIQDRRLIMEEQKICVGLLEERAQELRALHRETQAQERLAALDAEAMLRRHFTNVARGETHRAGVSEGLARTHQEREMSPDGRHARRLVERAASPQRSTIVTRQEQWVDDAPASRAAAPSQLPQSRTRLVRMEESTVAGPSPIQRVAPSERTPYMVTPAATREDRTSPVRRSGGGPLPPVPTSPTRRAQGHYGTPLPPRSALSVHRSGDVSPLAQLSKSLGQDPITQRNVAHAEELTASVQYNSARRQYKKALMQEALQ